jgi:hypothetical protein
MRRTLPPHIRRYEAEDADAVAGRVRFTFIARANVRLAIE